jgi:hypothetical protein
MDWTTRIYVHMRARLPFNITHPYASKSLPFRLPTNILYNLPISPSVLYQHQLTDPIQASELIFIYYYEGYKYEIKIAHIYI